MRRLASICALVLAGCSATPRPAAAPDKPAGPDPRAIARAVAQAAGQISLCYRAPKLNRIARQIVTVVHVNYLADGMPASEPVISRQSGVTDENRAYAAIMARAATDAIIQCVPVRLPAELYAGGWNEFDLTFSPRGLA